VAGGAATSATAFEPDGFFVTFGAKPNESGSRAVARASFAKATLCK
jgi:hypothetical protein